MASPVMGDSVFAQAYNAAVNSRRISFEFDIIAQVPCASSQGKRRAASSGAALPGIPAHTTSLVCRHGMRARQRAHINSLVLHVMRRAVVCPCNAGGMRGCKTGPSTTPLGRLVKLQGPGVDSTGGLADSNWQYVQTGGLVQFKAWSMPAQQLAWSRLSSVDFCAW
jgi:hypothetical protein